MATLAEIRAKLLAQDNKSADNANANRGVDAIYPFWNMDTDSTSVIRFLPDADQSNTFFWRERQIIKMTFPGVKGGDESKPVTVQVPCVEMWGDTCPVHAEIRPWFKDPSMEDIGRKYWKKRSYIFQGFVVTDPMNEETPENPIRRFVIGPQIFKLLKSALMDPDMENLPTDYDAGTDFRLTKTQKGQYADYSTSNWARKESCQNVLMMKNYVSSWRCLNHQLMVICMIQRSLVLIINHMVWMWVIQNQLQKQRQLKLKLHLLQFKKLLQHRLLLQRQK